MKIHLIGTGDVFSSRLSPSFVLDGCILIETPNGISKMLINQNEKIENLSLCLISHLHGDHFWDMPFLLLNKNKTKGKKVTVVGPVGIKKNIFKCCQMAFSSLDWEQIFYNTIENIYELSENEQINHEQYKVFAISVEHGNEKCFGFKIINKDKKVFSYLMLKSFNDRRG